MRAFNHKLVASSILLMTSLNISAQECMRDPRTVYYDGHPQKIYVSPEQKAAVAFPESNLSGADPEIPEGLSVNVTPIDYKISLSVENSTYTGLLSVDGASGKTYILRLVAREGCADSLVTIKHAQLIDKSKLARDRNGKLRGLMWYLIKGETPDGYRKVNYSTLSDHDKVVMRQGSVEFKLEQQLIGQRFIGTTYSVINKGRTPFRIAIENIDYSSPAVKEALGRVRKVSMLPVDRRLGPAPEFTSDLYADAHRGLMFVVSEKK